MFDFEGLNQATQLAITEQPKTAFQYGLTEGSGVLRDRIAGLAFGLGDPAALIAAGPYPFS